VKVESQISLKLDWLPLLSRKCCLGIHWSWCCRPALNFVPLLSSHSPDWHSFLSTIHQ
jgi:hypothetical protein